MKVSIIIPVYNASLTLNECLGAIFDSSFKDFEVIVVSDNSSDNSVEIAKTYNCKILELKENRGPSFARNKGAEIAESDILLFLDSDIILKKNSCFFPNKCIIVKNTLLDKLKMGKSCSK